MNFTQRNERISKLEEEYVALEGQLDLLREEFSQKAREIQHRQEDVLGLIEDLRKINEEEEYEWLLELGERLRRADEARKAIRNDDYSHFD